MAASTDFYCFPPDFDVQAFAEKNNKICVVAVIGKSRFAPFYSKASMLNPVVDRDVFQGFESVIGEDIRKGDLECYYDEDTQVLYLHMVSHMDSSCLVQHCSQRARDRQQENFYSYWQEAESRYARLLLLVFSLSHVVLLVHPTCSFDMTYIKFFRILDSVRLKLQPQLGELLRDLPVSKEWAATSRLCSPRVLFHFHTHTVGPNPDDDGTSKSRSQKLPPLKRMQHNLEDQIYRVLRRARVITNISNNSLFAVPANQEFVFISSRKNEATEPNTFLLNFMKNHFLGHDSPRSKSHHQGPRRGTAANSSSSSESVRSPLMSVRQENSFKEFLWQHVEIAFHKGFDDNVGRNPVPARFELPTASLWFEVCQRMHDFLFDATPEGRAQSALNLLRTLLDPDMKFSEGRCNKIISMAEAAYQSELPPFYVTACHLSKLGQAKRVFSQYARGPAFDKYLKQLEESCRAFWTEGRQQCEAVSLSGNLCVNQLHRALSEVSTEANKDLPVMAHSSQLKTKAACNCGSQQAEKDDPFDHRSANYDFYLTLEAACCGTLPHMDMPTFKPSSSLVTAAASPSINTEVVEFAREEGGEVKDVLAGMSTLSLALSLGQSGGGSDLYHHDSHLPDVETGDSQHDAELSQGLPQPPIPEEEEEEEKEEGAEDGLEFDLCLAEEAEGEKEEEKAEGRGEGETEDRVAGTDTTATESTEDGGESGAAMMTEAAAAVTAGGEGGASGGGGGAVGGGGAETHRQHSTTEYLAGMLHSNCPPGLLPKFPSWSLCCLDSAAVYSHQHGLDLPGFLTGSNFLLPWDLPVHVEKDRWPTITETTSKRGRHPRRAAQKSVSDPAENTVRVYIGMEYECPRGHRFFCSSPDKVIKVLGNCSVKDTANRLVNTDMPLYTPCHCHTPKGFLAQLMRVYTVTPEGPLRVVLQPKVRPAPHPCPIFHPGTEEIQLPPNGIWVLRLPQVYMGDNGPISSDPQNLHACIALKGLFSHRELTTDG
ncbi:LOW QUALITY PROTEIN: nonsense-mediated mRNA decay factor SMG8-like [Babylonia areolata]|uniref:LOW QUALITY PROTEIN: nonsense-mediated mRNA decay factor SMG8-like n=1 Tax=Babylonia areolata TaxID=304850 RepID=UPI003FD0B3D2